MSREYQKDIQIVFKIRLAFIQKNVFYPLWVNLWLGNARIKAP
jgi:hypothetical protein